MNDDINTDTLNEEVCMGTMRCGMARRGSKQVDRAPAELYTLCSECASNA